MPLSSPLYGTGQLFYGKCYVCLIAARTENCAKLGSILRFRNCTHSQRNITLFQPAKGHEIKKAKKGEKKKMLTPENWKDGKDGHRQRNWCRQTRGWTSTESLLGENDQAESAPLYAPMGRQTPHPGGHMVAPSMTGCPHLGDRRPQKVDPSVERVTSLGCAVCAAQRWQPCDMMEIPHSSPRVAELSMLKSGLKRSHGLGLPGGPVVKTLHFQLGGRGCFPREGAKVLLAMLRLHTP